MRRTAWASARVLCGAAILAIVVWRLGTGPFRVGIGRVSAWSLVVAAAVGAVTTLCAAWRWTVVARGLGVRVDLPVAVASYYRSQFLNTALPGGVMGDVHRGVHHGREAGNVSGGLRAVAWERFAGQSVQVALTLAVLVMVRSPVRASMPTVLTIGAVAAIGAGMLAVAMPTHGVSPLARLWRTARADVREGLFARGSWLTISLASVLVVAGHTATFLVAARTAGVTASGLRLLPLAMIVLVAMALPLNIGGWGPREGVAAALFAAAGLGAEQGVATATVYGVIVTVACLPGAVVLAVAWLRRRGPYVLRAPLEVGLGAEPEVAVHG
jgi:uncharacterized membrane protein YbhN (UPF0104 family)